jgi:flavin reductase ActVB
MMPDERAAMSGIRQSIRGGDMSGTVVDAVDFRNAMARFASGVTVVTTRDPDGRPQGFTASAFSSLSLEPPLVLVCLEKRAQCYSAFMAAPQMAISILALGQADIAQHFARKQADKFTGVATVPGAITGLPLIPGALVHLECRLYARLEGGDHTILVGEVLRAETAEREPLLHYNRQFGRFVPA